MLRIVSKKTNELTEEDRAGLMRIISDAFELITSAREVLDRYCTGIPQVMLAHDDDVLVGYQFYQVFRVGGIPCCQFSMAAKSPFYDRPGLQKRMGLRILLSSLAGVNPFGRFAVVGVCNNFRTYRNMLAVKGRVFPDVISPDRPCPNQALYTGAAERLKLSGLDPATGLIAGRAGSVGLKMKPEPASSQPDVLRDSFLRYVGGDVNQGVFTMVLTRPVVAGARFLLKQVGLV